jgi:hypothetical protein
MGVTSMQAPGPEEESQPGQPQGQQRQGTQQVALAKGSVLHLALTEPIVDVKKLTQ